MRRINFIENKCYSLSEASKNGVDESTLFLLEEKKLIEKQDNEFKFVFIGSLFKENKQILVHPKYRNNHFTEEQMDVFHNCLIKYNNSVELESEKISSSFTNVFYVLQDYLINGTLKNQNRIVKSDWSNPSWERMFNKTPAIINEQVVYWDKPISTGITLNSKGIENWHKECICFLIREYPVVKTLFPTLQEDTNNMATPDKDELLIKVRKELNQSSLSRERRVLKAIYDILLSNHTNDALIIGTRSVHTFFEHLCKRYVQDESSRWIPHFPKAFWIIKGKIGETKAHRPDIIFERNGKVYLYDAKYYDTNINQPGIQDITKQILYKMCIKNIKEDVKVHNGFIFPSERPNDHYSIETGKISYEVFGNDTEIKVHHQYDMELFKNY